MILYVNGDSHTAAAEAVNPHAFAEDDQNFIYLGRLPHPANLAVSWATILAQSLKCTFKCDAESAASNARILRTTNAWLGETDRDPENLFMILQWSTWERTEWLIGDKHYQINASGQDELPQDHQERYRQFIAEINWTECTQKWHQEIWQLHQRLKRQGIKHIFFNGNLAFEHLPENDRYQWGSNYIGPYDLNYTYDQWLRNNGFQTVAPNSWHFGREAHAAWARFVLQYIVDNKLI